MAITPADVKIISVPTKEDAPAAEIITAGAVVYLKSGSLYLADADATSAGKKPDVNDQFGVALNSGGVDQQILWARRRGDSISVGTGALVSGVWYAVSSTPGVIIPVGSLASTNYSILIGYASDDETLVLAPVRTGIALV